MSKLTDSYQDINSECFLSFQDIFISYRFRDTLWLLNIFSETMEDYYIVIENANYLNSVHIKFNKVESLNYKSNNTRTRMHTELLS